MRVEWDLSPVAPHAEKIVKAAIEAGDWQTVADLAAPEIPEEARFAYYAFRELATDRAIGMGVGPIPFIAIDAFARRYRIEGVDEFERFLGLIRAIDGAVDKKAKAS